MSKTTVPQLSRDYLNEQYDSFAGGSDEVRDVHKGSRDMRSVINKAEATINIKLKESMLDKLFIYALRFTNSMIQFRRRTMGGGTPLRGDVFFEAVLAVRQLLPQLVPEAVRGPARRRCFAAACRDACAMHPYVCSVK